VSHCKEVLSDRSLVRLFFDESFEDIPSVIVTPVAPSSHTPEASPKAAALTLVMDITRSSATVYNDYFDNTSKDYGVAASFTVVITGPPKLSTNVAIKKECPNYFVAT
jgi:hypothetical protein